MKGYNLINTIFLMLCASCTNQDTGYKGFLKGLVESYREFSKKWPQWSPLFFVAACAAFMSIFGGIYIYRNGWRSLVPKSWRKTDN